VYLRQTVRAQRCADWAWILVPIAAGRIAGSYSEALGKLVVLGECVGIKGDVEDPFGGTPEMYNRCAEQLSRLVAALYARLASCDEIEEPVT
jgi:hypothetical protein